MKLIFENNEIINFSFNESLIGERFKKIYKHLHHVPLQSKNWDNPYYITNHQISYHIQNLISFAKKLSIDVDENKCLLRDQEYFNYLHKIYEKNYDGSPDWLEFHEHIHICEKNKNFDSYLQIDYREKAGLLTKKVERKMLDNLQTSVKKGQLFTKWSELGKTPYTYFLDNEPSDIKRICELVKPWLLLRPKFYIALQDLDFTESNTEDFELWWSKYSIDWCNFNNLEKYDISDMFGVSVIGYTYESSKISDFLKQNILPKKIDL
jgi:hypothetical protein